MHTTNYSARKPKRISSYIFMLFILILPSVLCHGQSQEAVKIIDLNTLSVETTTGKTYFLEESSDLNVWLPVATYAIGDGTQKTVSISASGATKKFYRFRIVATNTSNPDDTDADGIDNNYEIKMGLDPNHINSLNDLAIVEVDSRISDKTPSTSLDIFNNYTSNGASLTFNRNANCWINDIDNISCISPWNNQATRKRAGTLITPRHVIFCAHSNFFVPATKKIYFVDDSGNVIERTILRTKRHASYGSPSAYNNDIVIGVLDADVPASIKCVKFFPDDWSDYLDSTTRVPSIRLNQHEEALVGDFYLGSIAQERAYHLKPTEPDRLAFYLSLSAPSQTGLYSGDSGNGGFVVIDSQLILTNVWTYGGPGSGTSVTNEKTIINTMIGDIDSEVGDITGHTIKEFNFSQYVKLADIPLGSTLVGSEDPPIINELDYPLLIE